MVIKPRRRTRDPLLEIPGIGPNLAADLRLLGYHRPEELRGESPEQMFRHLCEIRAEKIDRCVLYAFRCAAYFASVDSPEAELLKWWNWKDRTFP